MPVACIYNKYEGMKVVSFEDREKLLASGEWFNHPSCKTPEELLGKQEELKNEKQIRRRPRKRLSVSE